MKPISIFTTLCAENLSDKIFKITVITISAPIIYLIVPSGVWSQFLITPVSLLLFILAVVIGYLIFFLIEVTIGLTGVWTSDIDFLKFYLGIGSYIFSGSFIPLAFFPELLKTLSVFLPFKYTVSFPIEILLNKLTINKILEGYAVGLVWLVLSFIMYKIVFWRFNKSYQGYGA